MTTGRVFDVQRFSTDDGPGIRTTVFLKGCPLSCAWCHNPEGLERDIRLWAFENLCDNCGACVRRCDAGALSMAVGQAPVIDHAACTRCGDCVRACPRNALALDGRDVTSEQLLAELARDRVFHEVSGGGVTFSGGEPLSQARFVHEVAAQLTAQDVHTAVETTLLVPWAAVEASLGVIDLFLVDVKLAAAAEHRRATGVDNTQILARLARLAVRLGGQDRLVVRVPLIPGWTTGERNLRAIGRIVADIDPAIPVELMNYNPLAAAKYHRMGRPFALEQRVTAYSREQMDHFAAVVSAAGLSVRGSDTADRGTHHDSRTTVDR